MSRLPGNHLENLANGRDIIIYLCHIEYRYTKWKVWMSLIQLDMFQNFRLQNKTMIDPIKFDMYGAVRVPIPDTLAFSIWL